MNTRNIKKSTTKKNKPTQNQREYEKQVKRIKGAIRRAEKRGYLFGENVIPQKPKRITKSFLEDLARLKGNRLYDLADYIIDYETGETVPGLEGRKYERKKSAEKAKEKRKRKQRTSENLPNGGVIIANRVIDDFIAKLDEPTPRPYAYRGSRNAQRKLDAAWEASNQQKSTLKSLTFSVIASEGKEGLGYRLQEHADTVNECLHSIMFDSNSDAIISAGTELASIIKGSHLTMGEMMDLGEQDEWNQSMGDEMYGED